MSKQTHTAHVDLNRHAIDQSFGSSWMRHLHVRTICVQCMHGFITELRIIHHASRLCEIHALVEGDVHGITLEADCTLNTCVCRRWRLQHLYKSSRKWHHSFYICKTLHLAVIRYTCKLPTALLRDLRTDKPPRANIRKVTRLLRWIQWFIYLYICF